MAVADRRFTIERLRVTPDFQPAITWQFRTSRDLNIMRAIGTHLAKAQQNPQEARQIARHCRSP
jgi:hypothetical protein